MFSPLFKLLIYYDCVLVLSSLPLFSGYLRAYGVVFGVVFPCLSLFLSSLAFYPFDFPWPVPFVPFTFPFLTPDVLCLCLRDYLISYPLSRPSPLLPSSLFSHPPGFASPLPSDRSPYKPSSPSCSPGWYSRLLCVDPTLPRLLASLDMCQPLLPPPSLSHSLGLPHSSVVVCTCMSLLALSPTLCTLMFPHT